MSLLKEDFEIDYSDAWEKSSWWYVELNDYEGMHVFDLFFEDTDQATAEKLATQIAARRTLQLGESKKRKPRLGCVFPDSCDCVVIPRSGVVMMLSYED